MNNYSILLVEDDENLLSEYQRILNQKGYHVNTANNGREGLNLWKKNIYDLVLADLRMPELDGMELIKKIKKNQPLTQVIILSGEGREGDMFDAVNQHVFNYLKKPINLPDLLDSISRAISNRDMVLIALEQMVKKSPNQPEILENGQTFTPKRLYDEVRKNTPYGQKFYKSLKTVLTDVEPLNQTIDDILKMD